MSLQSVWTPEAETSFFVITDHLVKQWGALVADAFVSDVEHTIALLQKFPRGGVMEVRDLGIRSIPVARQVRLFYTIAKSNIVVLEFIDTRSELFQKIRE